MSICLAHHRAFCETLSRFHALDVGWDGHGAIPLRRKALLAALELFGRRPDLTIGARVRLDRGGVEVTLFRGGRDLLILICKAGSFLIFGHRSGMKQDVILSVPSLTETAFEKMEHALPSGLRAPFLSRRTEGDLLLSVPFEGFSVLRLERSETVSERRLLIGREGPVDNVYAYHDACDLPRDLIADQPLTGKTRLRDLVLAYLQERMGRPLLA